MKKGEQKEPAKLTVAELMKTSGVPLPVYLWLERFTGDDKYALDGADYDPATYDIARLVYDVLDSKHQETGVGLAERRFPQEARDFIEEWLYQLTNHYGLHAWSDPDLAVAALPHLVNLDGILMQTEGDSTFALLRLGIERLTTKRERREFLRDADGSDAEPEKESATNWRASFKLSRMLANPATPADTRREIQEQVIELCNAAGVIVDHPALVRRAFLVAVEQRPKGHVRDVKRARRQLLALLDSIPDEKGGDG